MFFLESKLVIGIIFKAIKSIFVGIYKFFKLLNLHVSLIIAGAGLITYLAGGFSISYVKYGFYILLVGSILLAILISFRKMGKGKGNRTGVQIVKKVESEKQEEFIEEQKTEINIKAEQYPKYFRSAKNPNLVWAEFEDRYELYKVEKGAMTLIRKDKKF